MDCQWKKHEANQACVEAKKAVLLFFHYLDVHRNVMFKLFHPNAQLTWNTISLTGAEDIQNLFMALPATQHVLNSINAVPILELYLPAVLPETLFCFPPALSARKHTLNQVSPFAVGVIFVIIALGVKTLFLHFCVLRYIYVSTPALIPVAAIMEFQWNEHEANQACVEAKKAVLLYFHYLDAHRNVMFKMFHPNAQLTWTKISFTGVEEIQKLFTALPATQHVLNSVNVLPILDSTDNGKYMVVLEITGDITFFNKQPVPFQQNFIAMAGEDHWIFCSTHFVLVDPHNV